MLILLISMIRELLRWKCSDRSLADANDNDANVNNANDNNADDNNADATTSGGNAPIAAWRARAKLCFPPR